ncbi:hypothetical protein MKC54_05155 [[Clostridium] innocuum]|nr:hypothetical protein [[Clostridium] innocuum]MCR0576268.1 hypothetical protein [[Clostridium] innocuum]
MKPILFNTEMVRAILEDGKTVTRRTIKDLPQDAKRIGWVTGSGNAKSYDVAAFDINGNRRDYKTRYLIGDTLYVRETWQKSPAGTYLYKTDNNGNLSNGHVYKWKPSIHMPKEAARLFLHVTNVRVERLQDMCLRDFINEGIVIREESFNDPENAYYQAKEFFRELWNSTIKEAELGEYGWDANPYVFAYEFEVISKAEAIKEY